MKGEVFSERAAFMQRWKNPRLMMILSAVVFGTIGVFKRHIPLSASQVALYRAVMAVMVLGGYLLLSGQKIIGHGLKKKLPLLLLSGGAMDFNWVLLFEAYTHTTVSAATLAYYLGPLLAAILCPLLFKERMNGRQWVCVLISALGLALITGFGDPAAASNHLLGVGLGLGAAALYASVMLLNKAIDGVPALQRTLLQFVAASLVLLPYTMLTDSPAPAPMTAGNWAALITLGVIHTGIIYCLYFSALRQLPGQQAAILSYIDPLTAVLLSVFLLGEGMTEIQILGGAMILGGALGNEIRPAAKEKIISLKG